MLSKIDHVVYAVEDLNEGMNYIANRLGVMPVWGGQHLGKGTCNALLSLGTSSYLEIVAPDPDQPLFRGKRWLSVDEISRPQITRWAAKSDDLEGDRQLVKKMGLELGEVYNGSRLTDTGILLEWELTDPEQNIGNGVIPFLINWRATAHPAQTLHRQCSLVRLQLAHPQAKRMQDLLQVLMIKMMVVEAPYPQVRAVIDSPQGRIELT